MSKSFDAGEDSDLIPEEKQVSFVTTKVSDRFRVHSEVSTVTRHLLAHSEFVEENRRVNDGEVVAVTGTIPVRFVSIGTGGRGNDNWSGLVSGGVFDD